MENASSKIGCDGLIIGAGGIKIQFQKDNICYNIGKATVSGKDIT
jgi:hypothetical protein